jgi:excinuclease ABC subunit C
MAFDAVEFLKTTPEQPGVYRMYNATDTLIYVGKARNLKKRVSQYFHRKHDDTKTTVMVSKIARVEFTITESEIDALLLEANLIKHHRPRYNVLLRDDKSYPYLYLATHAKYPRLDFIRGQKKLKGRYFGPYPTGGSARETLNLLQKCFMLRQCKDAFFAHRSRPCLQYQIKRCKAPCVGFVSEEEYGVMVGQAEAFLDGKSDVLLHELAADMTAAADAMNYERAGQIRDQIEHLRKLQTHQYIANDKGDADVLACAYSADHCIIVVVFIRQGKILGHRDFYLKRVNTAHNDEVYTQFIAQHYLSAESVALIPECLVVPEKIADKALYEQALRLKSPRRVRIITGHSEQYALWRSMAQRNADQALLTCESRQTKQLKQLAAFQKLLNLKSMPTYIECFDISHTQGEATKGSCVVFKGQGMDKSMYRQYNITDVKAGDDYAAMEQVVLRRYTRLLSSDAPLPQLVLIDGGKGQLQKAAHVLEELQIRDIILIGVAKGVSRKAGLERLFLVDGSVLQIAPHDPALQLIQHIRDESHRFGIRAHRKARSKNKLTSPLEKIAGVGPKKRQALLTHFGGIQALKKASSAAIAKVPGVNLTLAERIRQALI